MSRKEEAIRVAMHVLEAIRRTNPDLIADNMPAHWGMNALRSELLGEERIAKKELGCFLAVHVQIDAAQAGAGIPAFIKEGDFRNGFLKPYFPKESMPAVKALCSDLTLEETDKGCSVSSRDGGDWFAPLVAIDVKGVGTVVTFDFSPSGWTWITAEP